MMETVFYEDHHAYLYGMNNLKDRDQLKRKMTLDLEGSNQNNSNKTSVIKKAKYFPTNGNSLQTPVFQNGTKPEILSSPDFHKLNLASPELERLILNPQSLITPTPLANQAQVFFPKNVTEAQENYAQGFSDALAKLQNQNQLNEQTYFANHIINHGNANTNLNSYNHQSQQMLNNSNADSNSINSQDDSGSGSDDDMSENSMTSSSTSTYTTNGQMQGNYGRPPDYNSIHSHGQGGGQVITQFSGQGVIIKEEPQTVPTHGNGDNSSAPVSPIDMANQEKIKLERKRQRNRVAASKCRKRKLERISKLEDKVKQIKNENSELINVSNKLREAVAELKKEVMKHVQLGCQILISGNLNGF